jgi:hypothetical protein
MATTEEQNTSHEMMIVLSRLLLTPTGGDDFRSLEAEQLKSEVSMMTKREFDQLVILASSNHVIMRGLEVFLKMMQDVGDDTRAGWAQAALVLERARIDRAMAFLSQICAAFEEEKYDVAVIKSLDHWPDLGSDLDLYTNTKPEDISGLMRRRFGAQIAPRSWGDCLAGKWNYIVPGLGEAVEVHMGRLGQTGEQVAIASHLAKRTRVVLVGDRVFRVPSASDRLMISTLQRMYRHFYFRLCDIVDSAALVDCGGIDFQDLRSSASAAGIWEGVATYLAIVSDYVKKFSGLGIDLPKFVLESARFGGKDVFYSRGFLRVPIMPQSAKLYISQLADLVRKREVNNGARLSLLPWLATAALVGQKLTGSDKGIW